MNVWNYIQKLCNSKYKFLIKKCLLILILEQYFFYLQYINKIKILIKWINKINKIPFIVIIVYIDDWNDSMNNVKTKLRFNNTS